MNPQFGGLGFGVLWSLGCGVFGLRLEMLGSGERQKSRFERQQEQQKELRRAAAKVEGLTRKAAGRKSQLEVYR